MILRAVISLLPCVGVLLALGPVRRAIGGELTAIFLVGLRGAGLL